MRSGSTSPGPRCFGSARQKEIAELEEGVARGLRAEGSPATRSDRMERLALLYSQERQLERAIDQARKAMAVDGRPSLCGLHLIASCYDQLGATERAEKHYREAIRTAPGATAARFNLSLLLERQGKTQEALDFAEETVRMAHGDGVYRAWRAILWRRSGRDAEGVEELRSAAELLDTLPSLDPCQRFWRGRIAQELGEAPPAPRAGTDETPPTRTGPTYNESRLPGHTAALARRAS